MRKYVCKFNVSCLRQVYASCSDVVNPTFCPVCVNNAMEWWSDHEVKFPHVALMAQKYLAIPASSAPVFSPLKLIVERKRWRMDGGRVERVRCNKNFNA